MPVRPCSDSTARVSTLTGVSGPTSIRATTFFGSFGSRNSSATSPTLMPLNCTVPPTPSPEIGSVNSMS